jgi:hypothetical protein
VKRRKPARQDEAEHSPVQLALNKKRQSPAKALEAQASRVQVAPKKKNKRNQGKAAEAGANPSAGRTGTAPGRGTLSGRGLRIEAEALSAIGMIPLREPIEEVSC